LWSLRVTIVAMDSNKYYIFCVCVCNLYYTADKARATFCHLWPVQICHIFLPHYVINSTIFGKIYWKRNILIFSKILSKTFLSIRRIQQDTTINVHSRSSCTEPLICHILMRPELSQQTFEKLSNAKFNEKPSSGIRIFLEDRRTDRQTQRK
jgi:hypothetical protein